MPRFLLPIFTVLITISCTSCEQESLKTELLLDSQNRLYEDFKINCSHLYIHEYEYPRILEWSKLTKEVHYLIDDYLKETSKLIQFDSIPSAKHTSERYQEFVRRVVNIQGYQAIEDDSILVKHYLIGAETRSDIDALLLSRSNALAYGFFVVNRILCNINICRNMTVVPHVSERVSGHRSYSIKIGGLNSVMLNSSDRGQLILVDSITDMNGLAINPEISVHRHFPSIEIEISDLNPGSYMFYGTILNTLNTFESVLIREEIHIQDILEPIRLVRDGDTLSTY